ncbi:MAG TPA: M48 family metallopeptidase [Bacteroidales bacterium]|jgi:STE24 endopeptidase|nr:M48 family metallopeptidase [Bacteroidales bacterium]
MASTIFGIIIAVLVFDYALERILDLLNAKHRVQELPIELQDIYNAEEYAKQQQYEQTKTQFGFITASFSFILILGMLLFDGFAVIDTYIYSSFGTPQEPLNHILGGLLFFGIVMFASDILGIPFEIYSTFVIEEKFGFNKTTPKIFVFDKLKSWLLSILLGGGILAALLFLISYFGNYFWVYAWIFVALIMIAITMFYSTLIVPLFNKQTPLEEGELKQAIFEFSSKVGFKLDNIFVIDGSKRSTKANAYFSGLGAKKRIVLYDTLIQEMTTEEIVAVLAHEIGHYKKKHTRTMIVASLLQMGLLLYIFGLFVNSPWLTEALGIPYEQGKFHIALFVFSILYSPLSFIISIGMNILSRKHEFEADAFASQQYSGEYLEQSLRKLSKRNLSNLTPHPLYVFFYYSHPPLLQRIRAMRSIKK